MSMQGAVDVLARSMPIPEAGCWIWLGNVGPHGYGRVHISGRRVPAHRLAYEQAFGDIPNGLVVCHKCDTPSCVNPAHLFAATQQQNLMDMAAKGRHRESKKTHCPKGHPLSDGNLTGAKGIRECLTCKRNRNREGMRARRALSRVQGGAA